MFGGEDGPACLLLVLDARVLARSELGWNALFARPVAEVWMRVASEGGAGCAGLGGGWLEGLMFEVEGDGAGAGAGVLEVWVWLVLELGLPRMFSWLVMALGWVLGLGIGDKRGVGIGIFRMG